MARVWKPESSVCALKAEVPSYHKLMPNHTLRLALAQKTVIEFPVMLVVLPRELDKYNVLKPGQAQQQ